MIHYGLQYAKLLELAARELAEAKLQMADAAQEKREKDREAVAASNRLHDSNLAFQTVQQRFTNLVESNHKVAVDAYKEKTGSYPI